MRLAVIAILGCALMAVPAPSRAAGNQEELLKKIDTLQQQLNELKALQKASSEKKAHCLSAIGQEKFCTCIAEGLPAEVSFEQYVHTVITPKEGLGYDGLTPEQKKSVDQTLATRDKCAEKEKGGFLW